MNADNYESFEARIARERIEAAEARAAEATSERDAARKELAQVKRDIAWTMDKLKIADLIFHDQEGEGRDLGLIGNDPEDSARIAFINTHGRVALGNGSFVIAFDHGCGIYDETIPTPFNIRHIIDLCRKARQE